MPRLVFVQPDGAEKVIEVEAGLTVMEAAVKNGVQGVIGECGGTCACSTCHCYVRPDWAGRLPPKSEEEADLLDFAWEPKDTSRLTCQITVTKELDGMVLHVPAEQLS